MLEERESNFDLLRIFSAFSIVMLHVSAEFLQCNNIKVPTNCSLLIIILNTLTRFAVPCFFMSSGAFILADEKNADYKYFYHKSIKTIGFTGFIFCILYVLYNLLKLIINVFALHKHGVYYFIIKISDIIKFVFAGAPYFHLWYLFSLIGLYIAAPFVIRLAMDLRRGGVNLYGKFTVIFLCLASVSYITSDHFLNWDIGLQLCFLSYFLFGYKLRKWGKERKNNKLAFLLIITGMAINIGLGYFNYLRALNGLPVDVSNISQNPLSYGPLAPIEVVASCLIFAGFSVMIVRQNFYKLSRYTFLIYLIHAGVRDVIWDIVGKRLSGDTVIETGLVVVLSIAVFFISLIGAIVYKRFERFIRN